MNKQTNARELEAIKNCDRKPIHTIGYIQSFGCLLAMDTEMSNFTHVSENAGEYFEVKPDELLNMAPRSALGSDIFHELRNVISRSNVADQRQMLGDVENKFPFSRVAVHKTEKNVILEICSEGDVPVTQNEALDRLRWLLSKLGFDAPVSEILENAVDYLKSFSGFDRVMAYRFRPDGSGEVVAEARDEWIDSFLGLRFPEFDIPQQARQLYVKTPIRIISDVVGTPVNLLCREGVEPLDTSLAILRGSMPVHTQYLKNMGVGGTMSLPIVVEGKLWGLFAFHHNSPRYVGAGVDLAVEFAGQYLNSILNASLHTELGAISVQALKLANAVFVQRISEQSTKFAWKQMKEDFEKILTCDGVYFRRGETVISEGYCPNEDAIEEILECLTPYEKGISFSDNLSSQIDEVKLNETAGALAIRLGDDKPVDIIFFRNAALLSVAWAGKPDKEISEDDGLLRLSPRGSFNAFTENMFGRSEEWENSDMLAAKGFLQALEIAYQNSLEKDELFESLAIVVQELNHRVRNILSLVQSIVNQMKPESGEIEEAFTRLEARIFSLASAHNILSRGNQQSLDLDEAIRKEAEPYQIQRVAITGPKVGLSLESASVFVLVVHEMFSNSAKYGCLSTDVGFLSISWEIEEGDLIINWVEKGGPQPQPGPPGFGMGLIENAFEYEFDGSSDLEFKAEGLSARFTVPEGAYEYVPPLKTKSEEVKNYSDEQVSKILSGTVLVLEDDFLIAKQTEKDVLAIGAKKAILVNSVKKAIKKISEFDFDYAILDVNLSGERSTEVAQLLVEKDIPFVFVTGYDSGESSIAEFSQIPLVKKPVGLSKLQQAFGFIL